MRLSEVTGSKSPPLLQRTIGKALLDAVDRWPDKEAVVSVHQNLRLTYRELNANVDALARGLASLGLERGDRIAIWAPNCIEWLLTQLATASLGLVLVNLNPAYRKAEAEFALRKTGTKVLVAAARHKNSDYLAMVEDMNSGPFGSQDSSLSIVVTIGEEERPGWFRFSDLCAQGKVMALPVLETWRSMIDPADAVNIQFTSGTTGTPKGATLSHLNILNNGFFVGEAIGLTGADRLCIPVPLYHCFGMVMGNLACLTHGAAMIYPAPSFDPLSVLKTVDAERCTALYGVPTMFISILQHPEFASFDLRSLRTGIMAGSPCPITVMREVVAKMHMNEIIIAYGMTETSPVSFAAGTRDPLEVRVETVGRVMPHLESKIVDERGAPVTLGEPGEICVRGYSVMLGYWDDPETTRNVVDENDWMHTGDIGTIDDKGLCRIVGRLKDMIIRGGENIYPREIEEFLFRHPAIADVGVIGVPDQVFGEEVCAWIKLHNGQCLSVEDVRTFCSGRIAHYKIPKIIRFVDSFPLTATGKVQKFEMRKIMEAELATSATPAELFPSDD